MRQSVIGTCERACFFILIRCIIYLCDELRLLRFHINICHWLDLIDGLLTGLHHFLPFLRKVWVIVIFAIDLLKIIITSSGWLRPPIYRGLRMNNIFCPDLVFVHFAHVYHFRWNVLMPLFLVNHFLVAVFQIGKWIIVTLLPLTGYTLIIITVTQTIFLFLLTLFELLLVVQFDLFCFFHAFLIHQTFLIDDKVI